MTEFIMAATLATAVWLYVFPHSVLWLLKSYGLPTIYYAEVEGKKRIVRKTPRLLVNYLYKFTGFVISGALALLVFVLLNKALGYDVHFSSMWAMIQEGATK